MCLKCASIRVRGTHMLLKFLCTAISNTFLHNLTVSNLSKPRFREKLEKIREQMCMKCAPCT